MSKFIYKPSTGRSPDLTGKVYGRLTLIRRLGYIKCTWYLCQCACGVQKELDLNNLASGRTRSCGCLQKEFAGSASVTHGFASLKGGAKPSMYRSWQHIKSRCFNKKTKSYPGYGGRGISMCERWRFSFQNFLADMGEPPAPKGYTIERIDNDGNYEPGNCCWATRAEQSKNKRNTRLFEFEGRKQIMPDWAREKGIHEQTLWNRLKAGICAEHFFDPPRSRRKHAVENVNKPKDGACVE